MRYLIGLAFLLVGFLMAFKPNWFLSFSGRIGAAEGKMFSTLGGSRVFYQLLGILLIVAAAVILFGRFDFSFITAPYKDL